MLRRLTVYEISSDSFAVKKVIQQTAKKRIKFGRHIDGIRLFLNSSGGFAANPVAHTFGSAGFRRVPFGSIWFHLVPLGFAEFHFVLGSVRFPLGFRRVP